MTRQKQHIVKSERFVERGSRDQSQCQLRNLPRGGGLPRGTAARVRAGTDFCNIAPVESCGRLIARPCWSAKESAHPRESVKTLERRIHITAGGAVSLGTRKDDAGKLDRAPLQAARTCGARSIPHGPHGQTRRYANKPNCQTPE